MKECMLPVKCHLLKIKTKNQKKAELRFSDPDIKVNTFVFNNDNLISNIINSIIGRPLQYLEVDTVSMSLFSEG